MDARVCCNGIGPAGVLIDAVDIDRLPMTKDIIRILNINCNGLRKKKKRLVLGHIMNILQVGVCVATETHLRRAELKFLKIPGYVTVAESCRTAEGKKMGGGVVILVKSTLTVLEEEWKTTAPDSPVESCSITLFPKKNPNNRIRITGVYISPARTKDLSLDDLLKLSAPDVEESTQRVTSHLLLGDFNVTSWNDLFAE